MFCTNCGTKIPDDAIFCPECGFQVIQDPVPVPPFEEPVIQQSPVEEIQPEIPYRQEIPRYEEIQLESQKTAARQEENSFEQEEYPPAEPVEKEEQPQKKQKPVKNEKQEKTAKPKKKKKKKKRTGLKLFIVLLILILLAAAAYIAVFFLVKPKINLNKYVSVAYSVSKKDIGEDGSTDGAIKAKIYFDEEQFEKDHGAALSLKANPVFNPLRGFSAAAGMDYEENAADAFLSYVVDYKLSPSKELSEGDIVTLKWNIDEDAARDYQVTLVYSDVKGEVSLSGSNTGKDDEDETVTTSEAETEEETEEETTEEETTEEETTEEETTEEETTEEETTEEETETETETEEETTEEAVEEGIIIPDSSTRLLSDDEIKNLSDYDLRMAVNEIYARHGYIFNNQDLLEFYRQFDWYQETTPSGSFSTSVFNEIELSNVLRMGSEKDRRGMN